MHSSRIYTITNRKEDIPGLSDLLEEKRRTRKIWQRDRRCEDKSQLNQITRQIKNLISFHKITEIDKDLQFEVEKGNIWPTIIASPKNTIIYNHPLQGRAGLAFKAQHKAETLAETLNSNFRSRTNDYTHKRFHRRTRKEVRDFLAAPPTHPISPTKPLEIKKTLKRIHNEKASGPHNIKVNTLKQMLKKGITHITKIFSTSPHHFPSEKSISQLFPNHKKILYSLRTTIPSAYLTTQEKCWTESY